MKRSIWILLALLAGLLVARRAEAHIVPVGVGTQTWIDIRPRKLVVRFNLGFSSLLGLTELRKADTDHDTEVSAPEEQVYLGHLIERVLPQLRFHLDGKPVEFKVLNKQAAGLRGKIAAVAFDTFFDLEADLPIGAGSHELVYYEGTYEGEVSQQILYVVTDRANDFGSWETEQKAPGPPPVDADGALTFQGRDVTVRFEFLRRALERDKAEALIEPCMAGLQDAADGLATDVARSAERDLSTYAGGPVRLGVQQQSIIMSAGRGFKVSAPTASDRDGSNTGGLTKLRTDESVETGNMMQKMREPFSAAIVLLFLFWGALHATGPGHGKTMVAAYLLGTKGRLRDAVRLGLIVTFTHTFTLYTFGLGLVYLVERMRLTAASQDTVYRRSVFLLTLASGIGLSIFGLLLAWRRHKATKAEKGHSHDHEHDHSHAHDHAHAPALPTALEAPKTGKKLGLVMAAPIEVSTVEHAHDHDHEQGHTHTHDGHTHSHGDLSENEHAALHAKEAATEITSFKDLLSLGIAGGIVPCPAGVTLIVGSIALQQSALKTFTYLNAFSIGLGAVLVGIAAFMVFSRRFLDRALAGKRKKTLDLLPVVSAVLVSFIGLGIAYEAFDPNLVKAREKLWGLVASSHSTTKAK